MSVFICNSRGGVANSVCIIAMGLNATFGAPKIPLHLSPIPDAFIFAGPQHVRERATRCAPAERAATTFALGRLALLLFKQHT